MVCGPAGLGTAGWSIQTLPPETGPLAWPPLGVSSTVLLFRGAVHHQGALPGPACREESAHQLPEGWEKTHRVPNHSRLKHPWPSSCSLAPPSCTSLPTRASSPSYPHGPPQARVLAPDMAGKECELERAQAPKRDKVRPALSLSLHGLSPTHCIGAIVTFTLPSLVLPTDSGPAPP